jgi:hypothetical protein
MNHWQRSQGRDEFAGNRSLLGLTVVLLLTLAGCVTVGVHTTGAGSADDLKAENAYIAVYMDHMTVLSRDLLPFAASGSNPGVCNKGGTKQGCYDVDAKVITDLNAMLDALSATTVPPRFAEANGLLRDAITKNVQGLDLRNRAIANNDNDAWQRHGPLLEQAEAGWKAAYASFPADNRPAVAP